MKTDCMKSILLPLFLYCITFFSEVIATSSSICHCLYWIHIIECPIWKQKHCKISANSTWITEIQSSFLLWNCVERTYKRIFSNRTSSGKISVSILFMILHYPTNFLWIKIIFYTHIALIRSEVIRKLTVHFYSQQCYFLYAFLF